MRPDAIVDYQDTGCAVIRHDARDLPLEDGSVDLIVTSPPYFALRSYRDEGEHYAGQIGSEDTPELFLDALDECMVEWRRVLKPSGSVWVNLGDKYSQRVQIRRSSHQPGIFPGKFQEFGETWKERREAGAVRMPKDNRIGDGSIPEKSLIGLPWRFAIRQIDAGWILRAEVVWSKPNGLPESVTDRVRRSHEQWFHFVKEPRYFSAVDEIREPHTTADRPGERLSYAPGSASGSINADGEHERHSGPGLPLNPLGRLPGSVWVIPSEPLLIPDDVRALYDLPDHFAAFPQELPRRIILGWSPEKCCADCGTPLPLSYDTSARTEVRTVWGFDNGEPQHRPGTEVEGNPQQPLLQPNLLESMERLASEVFQTGSPVYDEGLRRGVGAGESDGAEVGLRDGAPTDNGGAAQSTATSERGRSPSEPHQGRQPTREPGTDGEGTSRPLTEASPEAVRLSELQVVTSNVRESQPCPNCDSRRTTPGIVADFFGGTGTTCGVAKTLGRFGISNDLSASYNRLAVWRITESGAFQKSERRMWEDRQGSLL